MYPIYMYENARSEGVDFETFSNKMVEICNKHKQTDKALAFGFILCDFDNPQIWKILNDKEYWLALNEITGVFLSIFSLNYRPPDSTPKNIKSKLVFNALISMPTNLNPRFATNALIDKYFKETEINYPAILFFQVDNNSVVDSLLVDLKEQEIEKAFLELKNYMTRAASALKKITAENRKNDREIFDCLEREVKSLRTARKIKRITQNVFNITEILSTIKGIL
jgi:hypothetical protein